MAVINLATSGLTIPPAAALNTVAQARGLAAAGARSLIPVTYGVDRQPALILNVLPKAGDANTLLVQCLWGHALHQVDELQLNDQALPSGSTVTTYTGSQVTADAVLVAAFAAQGITYTDTLAGYAYSVVAMPTRSFEGQLNISARLYGRKLYDPRKDSTAGGSGSHRLANAATWEWSDNPSLALADWASNTVYGAGEGVLWSSVPAAANANDATVGSPAEKRRTVGVSLTRDGVSLAAVAETLRAYAGCWLVPTASGLRLLPDADAAPVASYSHASGQIKALEALSLRDLGNVPTAVEVLYTDTTQVPWREASAVATMPGAGTTRPWRLSTVAMPGVQRYSQAYREAVERLNKLNLGDLSFPLEVFDQGIQHDAGDIITVTHPVGLSAKPMRVTDVELVAHGRWRLAVTEHDPAAYSDEVQTAPSIPDTNRTAAGGPASQVAGFAGTVSKGRITWVWTPGTDADYGATELRTSNANWGLPSPAPAFRGAANTFGQVVTAAGTYTLWAKHFGVRGNASATAVQASVVVSAADLVQDGQDGQDGQDVFVNDGGFEVPEADTPWYLGVFASIATSGALEGSQCLSVQQTTGSSSTDAARNKYFPVVVGARYRFGVAIKQGAVTPDGTIAIRIVWRDAAGTLIGSTGVNLAATPSWALYSASGVVPAGATRGRVEVRPAGQTTGEWLVDSCTVEPDGVPGADGPQGPAGVNGVAGTSVAEINVYIRSTSEPPDPSGGSFNFSTQALTPPVGWSVGVPSGTDPVWVARGLATTGTPGATVTPTWGGAAAAFANGQAVDVIFRRSASQPATPGASSGVPAGWYSTVASVPAGPDPLWSSFGERSAPTANWQWQAPVQVQGVDGAAGPQGPQGVAGNAGTSVAEVNVYRRASSTPATPTGGSFNFTTQALTAPASWSVGVPAGTDPVYVARGIASTATPGATVTPTWGAPALAFTDGQAVDAIFRRSATQPSTPAASAGTPAGWYSNVSAVPAGADPMWSSFGKRPAPAANWTWETPVQVQGVNGATGPAGAQGPQGPAGVAGSAGTSVAEINAYIRSTSEPPDPSGGSFNFTTLVLTPPVGWSVGVPAGTDPVYVARGLASTATPGATVVPSWGSSAVAFADGQAVDVVFRRSSTQPATPSPSPGVPAGWYSTVASVPAGADPLWSSFGERISISANWVWQAPVRVQGVDGATGPTGATGATGTPGAAAVSSGVDRVSVVLAADSTGVVDSGQLPVTVTAYAKLGATVDTANWTWTRGSTSGITTTISGAAVTITAMNTALDSGTVTILGSKAGQADIELVLPVTKAKAAAQTTGPRDFSGGTYASRVATGTDATATVRLSTVGVVADQVNGASYVDRTAWHVGAVSGSFSVFATYSGDTVSGTFNTWQALSSSRTWTLTQPVVSPAGEKNATVSFQIRDDSSGAIVATGSWSLTAIYEA